MPDSQRPVKFPDGGDAAGLSPGTPVAVRNRYTSGWAGGFVVEGPARRRPPSYRLRRLSDNAVLPATFPAEDLRLT